MRKEPLYKMILRELKRDILNGVYQIDEQIPTELELSERYEVSRITSKRVLTELENEGLIYRLRGKGSFVKAHEKTVVAQGQTDILLILPFPDDSGFGNYAQGIFKGFEGTDYRLVMQVHAYINEATLPEILSEYAGVIYYPVNEGTDLELLYTLYLNQMPTVILDKVAESIDFSAVVADNQQGGYLATKHLLASGLKKVAFISSQRALDVSTIRERYLGYLKALHETPGTVPLLFQPTDEASLGDYEALIASFIKEVKEHQLDGIVAENDLVAIALINHLKELDIKIPADISVIGFDNIQASELIEPKLTTIKQDFVEIGLTAAKQLMSEIEDPTAGRQTLTIPVEFIQRDTTKKVPSS